MPLLHRRVHHQRRVYHHRVTVRVWENTNGVWCGSCSSHVSRVLHRFIRKQTYNVLTYSSFFGFRVRRVGNRNIGATLSDVTPASRESCIHGRRSRKALEETNEGVGNHFVCSQALSGTHLCTKLIPTMSAEWLIALGVVTSLLLVLLVVFCILRKEQRRLPDSLFGVRRRDSLHPHRSALLHLASRNESLRSFPRVPTHSCRTSIPPLQTLPVAPTHVPVLETSSV